MPYEASPDRYETMNYARCGTSGLRLPQISLGLWHNFGDVDALENQRALLRRAFDKGITHFDLANNYGPPPGRHRAARRRTSGGCCAKTSCPTATSC